MFSETPDFVIEMINAGEYVNDSVEYRGTRAEDNLIKSAKYLKASSKDQIAVKNFLISLAFSLFLAEPNLD